MENGVNDVLNLNGLTSPTKKKKDKNDVSRSAIHEILSASDFSLSDEGSKKKKKRKTDTHEISQVEPVKKLKGISSAIESVDCSGSSDESVITSSKKTKSPKKSLVEKNASLSRANNHGTEERKKKLASSEFILPENEPGKKKSRISTTSQGIETPNTDGNNVSQNAEDANAHKTKRKKKSTANGGDGPIKQSKSKASDQANKPASNRSISLTNNTEPHTVMSRILGIDLEPEDVPAFLTQASTYKKLSKSEIELKLGRLMIQNRSVHEEHMIEKTISLCLPKTIREQLKEMDVIADGKLWTQAEDIVLLKNWESFRQQHKLETDDWQIFDPNTGTPRTVLLGFYRCMGLGLPKRSLQSISRRFIHIKMFGTRKKYTAYTKEEDNFILFYLAKYSGKDRFARLAKAMNRARQSVRRHYEILIKKSKSSLTPSQSKDKIRKMTECLQVAMKITDRPTLERFRKLKTLPYKQIGDIIGIPEHEVYRLWTRRMYHGVKLVEKVLRDQVVLDAIREVMKQKVDDILEVSWKEVARQVTPFHRCYLHNLVFDKTRRFKKKGGLRAKCELLEKVLAHDIANTTPTNRSYIHPLKVSIEDGVVKILN